MVLLNNSNRIGFEIHIISNGKASFATDRIVADPSSHRERCLYAVVLTHKITSQTVNAFAFVFVLFFSSLSSAVDECKKRWRSLRDAFMKQYKLYSRGDTNSKKRWLFYEQMEFLGPYFDK